MDARVEDRIVVESERAAQSGRAGVIEEVLAHDPPRFASAGTTSTRASSLPRQVSRGSSRARKGV
jgi:hypothetical protein